MYGEFRGRLEPRAGGTSLEGDFLAYSAWRLKFLRGFLYAWGALVLVASVLDWQGFRSLPFLIAAPICIALGYWFPKFYDVNIEVEADLLFEEIQARLKGSRVSTLHPSPDVGLGAESVCTPARRE